MLADGATLLVNTGNFFTAPVDTPLPTALPVVATPWVNVGHTSLSDILASESDGGEATVVGTLQNKQLRTTYSTRTESFSITLQQWDKDSLKLYYGSNAAELANGLIAPNVNPTPTQAAFLAVFIDSGRYFALYAPKAEIYRGDDVSISDTENLAGLPIKITPLQSGTNQYTYAVTPLKTTP